MNRVPTQITVGAQRERGGQTAAVEDAAGRHHRHLVADGVDDLGDQRHGGHQARVTAGLGALGHHQVAPRGDRPLRVAHLAAHVGDEHVVLVAEVDGVDREPRGRPRRGWPRRRSGACTRRQQLVAHDGEEVDPEGPVGRRPGRRPSGRPAARRPWWRRRGSRTRRPPRRPPPGARRRRRPSRPASPGARCPRARSVGSASSHLLGSAILPGSIGPAGRRIAAGSVGRQAVQPPACDRLAHPLPQESQRGRPDCFGRSAAESSATAGWSSWCGWSAPGPP